MTTGKFGSEVLLIGAQATSALVMVGTANENMVVNVRVVNIGVPTLKVRVAIGTGASPADKDYVAFDEQLATSELIEPSGLSISVGEKIWVYIEGVSPGKAAIRVHGMPTH